MIYCFRKRSNDRFHNWKKGELSLTEKKNTSGVLKVLGVLMILFGVIYALLGTLALMGTLTGMLPGHEKQEVILVVLAYAVALFSLICGIVCCAGAIGAARTMGIILMLVGLASLVYAQISADSFNLFDCIGMVLGAAIYGATRTAK